MAATFRRNDPPLPIVEVLSPSNGADTWSNVALFSTLPSVQEIAVVESEKVGVHVLRRAADGTWPRSPELIETGSMPVASIDLAMPVAEVYRWTELAPDRP